MLFAPPVAEAQTPKTVLGTLTCTATKDEIDRSTNDTLALACSFQAFEGGYAEDYAGTLRRLPEANPIAETTVLIWTVSGQPGRLSPGVLEQQYVGVSAAGEQEIGQLRGQRNEAIILSPMAHDGDTEGTVKLLNLDLKRTRA